MTYGLLYKRNHFELHFIHVLFKIRVKHFVKCLLLAAKRSYYSFIFSNFAKR